MIPKLSKSLAEEAERQGSGLTLRHDPNRISERRRGPLTQRLRLNVRSDLALAVPALGRPHNNERRSPLVTPGSFILANGCSGPCALASDAGLHFPNLDSTYPNFGSQLHPPISDTPLHALIPFVSVVKAPLDALIATVRTDEPRLFFVRERIG